MTDTDNNCLTVSDLTELIKNVLKINFDQSMYIIGEISNFKISKTNAFFTLKDADSSINAVMWNYTSKKHKLNEICDGKKVQVYGNLTVFTKSGTYNLVAYNIELLGIGNLHQEYLKTKEHYSKLGYFDEEKKKKLPLNLNKIGIITAFDGAALQDFLYVLKNKNFIGEIYIKNCIVQGKDCPISIAKALKEMDKMKFDVIVIARGGGSFEDLYGFSHKLVLEELHKCKTCTISAIGHEVDFMLSDFVADIRAPTPSIAGQIISSRKDSIYNIEEIIELQNKLKNIIDTKLKFFEYDIIGLYLKSPFDIIKKQLNDIELIKNNISSNIDNKLKFLEYNIAELHLKSPEDLILKQSIELGSMKSNLLNSINNKLTFLWYNALGLNITSPIDIIKKQSEDLESMEMKLSNIINTKFNIFDADLNVISNFLNKTHDPNVILSNGFCLVYDSNDKHIHNIDEFIESTNKRKKLKLKFMNQEVLFDIRNIKLK